MNRFTAYLTPAAKDIAAHARALGVAPGDILLVHSSLKSLGVPVSPGEVVAGLLDALGPDGTLMLPALSYEFCGASNPFFDVRTTPSCVGAIPEWFRRQPGVLRSLCPTHSCAAIGPHARQLLCEHQLDETPCGPHSPFAKLRALNGKVLFLGCGERCNTSMHAVEELAEPPYLFGPMVAYTLTDSGGQPLHTRCRAHNFAGTAQRYERVPAHMAQGVRRGKILAAACTLLDAVPMWETALAMLQADPGALTERI